MELDDPHAGETDEPVAVWYLRTIADDRFQVTSTMAVDSGERDEHVVRGTDAAVDALRAWLSEWRGLRGR